MSDSQDFDPMDIVPLAPSPPSTSPPWFILHGTDEDEEHNPQEWTMEDQPMSSPYLEDGRPIPNLTYEEDHPMMSSNYQEDYDATYQAQLDAIDAYVDDDMEEIQDFQTMNAKQQAFLMTCHQRSSAMITMHSSKTKLRWMKEKMRKVEILDSVPETQGIGPDGVVRGSEDERLRRKPGRRVEDYLAAWDEAMTECLEDARELAGDAIRTKPRLGHVQDEPCRLCRGEMCQWRHNLDAFEEIPEADFEIIEEKPQYIGKGKARLVDVDKPSSRSKGKGKARHVEENKPSSRSKSKGKVRAVEEDEPGLRAKEKGKTRLIAQNVPDWRIVGKGKTKLVAEDEPEEDELGSLLAQAQQLFGAISVDRPASRSSKSSISSEKQKPDQSTSKKSSGSRRSSKK